MAARGLNINYLAHLDPRHYSGGGELVWRQLLDAGKARGHSSWITTKRPNCVALHERPDLWWGSDIWDSPGDGNWAWSTVTDLLDRNPAPLLVAQGAYVDLCGMSYYPCSWGATCLCETSMPWRRDLFHRADLLAFLSPLHHRMHEKRTGPLKGAIHYIEPFPQEWPDDSSHGKRDIETLFVGVVNEAKGADLAFAEWPNTFFVGDMRLANVPENMKWTGKQSRETILALMRRSKTLICTPRWPNSYGLNVVEALAQGCEVIAPAWEDDGKLWSRMGALSCEWAERFLDREPLKPPFFRYTVNDRKGLKAYAVGWEERFWSWAEGLLG